MNNTSWIQWLSGPPGSAFDLSVRSTILLAILLGAWWVLGRRRPLIGSAIGQVGMLGLLILPISARLGPTLSIPILEAPVGPASPLPAPRVAEAPNLDEASPLARDAASNDLDTIAFEVRPPVPAKAALPPIGDPSTATAAVRSRGDLRSVVIGVYGSVVMFLLVRLAGSLASVGRLLRSSIAVDDPAWLDALARLRERLGIARPVALARSVRVGVPVVVGWLRPTILLPESTTSGDPIDHAEAILLHELAHVRRGDYAWNLLLRLVGAVYWPHPMAWLLARAVAESRELACDAFCVSQMGGPASYRAALLAMAEGLTRPSPALSLAMASRPRLARRVAKLDQGHREAGCLPRRSTRVAVAAIGLALAAALGPAQITRGGPRPGPTLVPASVVAVQVPEKAIEPPRAPGVGRVFRLRVVAADTGKPVPRADVRVWLKLSSNDWRRTDDEGRLDIIHHTGPDDRSLTLDAWGDGFAMQRHYWADDPNVPIPDEATLKLQLGESLGGLVQDEEGRPVAGAFVYLWSHNYKHQDRAEILYDLRAVTGPNGRWRTGGAPQTTGEILGFHINHPNYVSDRDNGGGREKPSIEALRAGKAVSVLKKGVPIEGRVLSSDGQPIAEALVISTERPDSLFSGSNTFAVKTDAQGRFRTGQVKAGDWHLIVRASGHAPAARKLKVGTAIPIEEIRLEPPHSFRARVIDPEGKPIGGAFVNIDTWQGYRCLGVFLYSDADGRVRWDDAPEGNLLVNVDCQGYLGLFNQRVQVGDDLAFTLKPALAISGFVRDAETKKGVARAEIEFGAVDPKTGEVTTWQPAPSIGRTMISEGWLYADILLGADAYKLRITGEGYEPFVSRAFRREEKAVLNYDVTLVPGRPAGPLATALRPDGRPLGGARIVRSSRSRISLHDGQVNGEPGGRQAVTAADGTFAIPPGEERGLILILGDDCFAYANTKALAGSPRLQARPFGRVEGRFMVGDRPLANRPIDLSGHIQDDSTSSVVFLFEQKATTDAEGRFTFDKVVPMANLRVARQDVVDKPGTVWSVGEPVRVEDGKTTVATVGGKGRPVVGRVDPPEDWTRPVDFTDQGKVSIETNGTNNPYPLELMRGKTSLSDRGWSQWLRTWHKTPEGRAYADARVLISVAPAPDGSFRFDDVPPGEYRVTIRVNEPDHGRDRGPFAPLTRTFAVPPIPGGRTDEPLDLGAARLRIRAKPKPGDPAPPFEATTVDGKKLTIPGDFAGKFLLLDFGTMWDDQSRLQVVRMNDVFARFGKDDRFSLLSLIMAADRPESRAFVAEKGEPWPQSIVGPLANPIADAYGVEPDGFPAALVIGPDGRIVARDLGYAEIGKAIAKALGIREPAPKP